jgi:FrmR/RcnR family transcriptional regulator, repressor of frmRAB operon
MRERRMRGQVEAIERALKAGADCAKVMHLAVSRRGAASSLMAEPLEDLICMHICMHVSDPARDRDRER